MYKDKICINMYKDNNNITVGCSYIGGSFINIETKLILIQKKKKRSHRLLEILKNLRACVWFEGSFLLHFL